MLLPVLQFLFAGKSGDKFLTPFKQSFSKKKTPAQKIGWNARYSNLSWQRQSCVLASS
jgi:hypothetical protein